MTVGPIPLTAIMDYADRQKFDPPMHDAFVDIVTALDDAYLGLLAKDEKAKPAPAATKKRRRMR